MAHDEHGSVAGDGHLHLEYQPALPMSNGKVIIWLFLSTEIMFFAGLIGTFIVLRFGAPTWPTPAQVHLSEPIGAFNTFVLIFSSLTVVLALESAKANKGQAARLWLALTLILGTLFLGVKGYEYNAKFSHGIYPAYPHGRIYERSDPSYLSAIRKRLQELQVSFADEKNPSQEDHDRSILVQSLLDNDVKQAELMASTDPNPVTPRMAMDALAAKIMPLPVRHARNVEVQP